MSEIEEIVLQQPDEISTREKEDAMGAYLMMFAAIGAGLPLPVINLIASIIYYFINNKKSKFVRFHAMQAMFAQIPTTIMNASIVFWTIGIIFGDFELTENYWAYIITVVLINILYFVFNIIAAIKARKGLMYYLFFFGELAFKIVYLTPEKVQPEKVNNPPKL